MANRERGCGARVLLDEKLLAMEARPEDILGYEREFSSARALASFVAQGGADAGVGTERTSRLAKGLEFVPLQTEWLDIVVAKSTRTEQARRLIKNKAADPLFQQELETLTGCSAARMGAIVYEC